MEAEPQALLQVADPRNSAHEEGIEDITSIIPRANYANEYQDSDFAAQRRSKLTSVLYHLPSVIDIESSLSSLEISSLIDYTTWAVLVDGNDNLKFDEKLLTKYLNNLMNSNIDNAVQRNDSAQIASSEAYMSVANSLIKLLKHLANSDLRKSSILAKLDLLEIDLKLLRQGNLSQFLDVLKRVDRIFSIETTEFDPKTIGSRSTSQEPEESQHIDSSPPIDSSDSGDHGENSIAKDSQPNILTQSTQLIALDTRNLSLESHVEVQATSSSNGTSQQSKDSQQSQEKHQVSQNGHKLSEEEQPKPVSQNGSTSTKDPALASLSLDGILRVISSRITDEAIKIDLLTWAKDLRNTLTSSKNENYRLKDLKSSLDSLLQILETSVNGSSLNKSQDISIRSVDSPISNKRDSSVLDNSLTPNENAHHEITKVFTDYMELRFSEFSEATKIVDEKMNSLTRAGLLINSLKDSFESLGERQTSNELKVKEIEDTIKADIRDLSDTMMFHMNRCETFEKGHKSKFEEISKQLTELSKRSNISEGKFDKLSDAYAMTVASIANFRSEFEYLKANAGDNFNKISQTLHNLEITRDANAIAFNVDGELKSLFNEQARHQSLITSIQLDPEQNAIELSNLKHYTSNLATKSTSSEDINELKHNLIPEIQNLKVTASQMVRAVDFALLKEKLDGLIKDFSSTVRFDKVEKDFQDLHNRFVGIETLQASSSQKAGNENHERFEALKIQLKELQAKFMSDVESIKASRDFENLNSQIKLLNEKHETESKLVSQRIEDFNLLRSQVENLSKNTTDVIVPNILQYMTDVRSELNEMKSSPGSKVDNQRAHSELERLRTDHMKLEQLVKSISDANLGNSRQNQTTSNKLDSELLEQIKFELGNKIFKVESKLKKKVDFDNTFLNEKFVDIASNMEELRLKLEDIEAKRDAKLEVKSAKQEEEDSRFDILMKEIQSMKQNQVKMEAENKFLKERLGNLERRQVPLSANRTSQGSSRPAVTRPAPPKPPKPPQQSASQINSRIASLLNRQKVPSTFKTSSSPEPPQIPQKRPVSEVLSTETSRSASPGPEYDIRKIKIFKSNEENYEHKSNDK